MKKRANLVIVRPGSFEELEGVEIIGRYEMGDQVPGQYYLSTICIACHLFSEDWQF